MRHLGSLALSLVLGPAIWLLTGFGLTNYGQGARTGPGQLNVETVVGVLLLLVAGGLYALLVSTRLSPVGPVAVALFFLLVGLWVTVDRASFFDVIPRDGFEGGFALSYPADGFAFLLAMPLLASVASPRRWTRYDRPGWYGAPATATTVPTGAAYPPPQGHAPGYSPRQSAGLGYPQGPAGAAGYPPPAGQGWAPPPVPQPAHTPPAGAGWTPPPAPGGTPPAGRSAPATDPVTDRLTEPVTEPVTEPATEPVTQPRPATADESPTEPVTEPVAGPAHDPDPTRRL